MQYTVRGEDGTTCKLTVSVEDTSPLIHEGTDPKSSVNLLKLIVGAGVEVSSRDVGTQPV